MRQQSPILRVSFRSYGGKSPAEEAAGKWEGGGLRELVCKGEGGGEEEEEGIIHGSRAGIPVPFGKVCATGCTELPPLLHFSSMLLCCEVCNKKSYIKRTKKEQEEGKFS